MSSKKEPEEFTQYHKDGTIWAKGHLVGDEPTGYWEWFRKDGTILRSGYFRDGVQVGKWATYDKNGAAYEVTDMKDGKKGSEKTVIKRN